MYAQMWPVGTPATEDLPGWCLHQPECEDKNFFLGSFLTILCTQKVQQFM